MQMESLTGIFLLIFVNCALFAAQKPSADDVKKMQAQERAYRVDSIIETMRSMTAQDGFEDLTADGLVLFSVTEDSMAYRYVLCMGEKFDNGVCVHWSEDEKKVSFVVWCLELCKEEDFEATFARVLAKKQLRQVRDQAALRIAGEGVVGATVTGIGMYLAYQMLKKRIAGTWGVVAGGSAAGLLAAGFAACYTLWVKKQRAKQEELVEQKVKQWCA